MHDVIVVGVGAMGSATCWHLAKRGARVLGIEQHDVPHALGSSGGHSRLIRLAYYEHPDYVPLLRRAYALWDEIERESGRTLLHETGGLYLGRERESFVAESLRAAQRHDLPHEMLDRDQIGARFPQFRVPEDHVGFFEPGAGALLSEDAIAAFAAAARQRGAEIHTREAVVEWRRDDAGVTVRTDRATHRAAHVVFCAGAWTDRLLRDLGVPLVVTRQVMGWVAPRDPAPFALGTFPCWAIQNDDGSLHYGMPILPDAAGLKIAHHGRGPATDVASVDRTPRATDEDDFRPALRRLLPAADGPLAAMRVCLYTGSPDSHFVVDRHPRERRATIACGFSGHGFKFASVIGEALADLSTRGATELPIGFLGFRRFAA
jgi:sarcosine oxidase